MTFFDEMKCSFVEVDKSSGPEVSEIDTIKFLDASLLLVTLFDLLGSSAFVVVQKDMKGNIDKVRTKLMAEPTAAATLQSLVLLEAGQKNKTATQGLLWLSRGLQFTAQAMRETVDLPSAELTKTFTDAYSKTLSQYHGMLVKPVFKLAMKACPYRADFFKKLGQDQELVMLQLTEWLVALEKIVESIMALFASGNYGKGL